RTGQSAQIAHQLRIGLQIGEGDYLADFGVRVAACAGTAEAAPAAAGAAKTETNIGLVGVTLFHRFLFGGAHIGDGEHDIRRLLGNVDPAKHGADAAADQAAEEAADIRS